GGRGTRPAPAGGAGDGEGGGNRAGCRLGGAGRDFAASGDSPRAPPANQVCRQRRELVDLIFGPAIHDRDIFTFDVAGFFQALAKCTQAFREPVGRYGAEEPYHRHGPLLCTYRERPRDRRAAEERDELTASHCSMPP